jgi:hypothetical protein
MPVRDTIAPSGSYLNNRDGIDAAPLPLPSIRTNRPSPGPGIDPERADRAGAIDLSPLPPLQRLNTDILEPPGEAFVRPNARNAALFGNLDEAPEPVVAGGDGVNLNSAEFYDLMGMRAPNGINDTFKERALPDRLLYRILTRYRNVNMKYRLFAVNVPVLWLAQLVIGIVLIVLGALRRANDNAIAVLGAVLLFTTGMLQYLYSQHIPERLRRVRDALRHIIFAAEELDRDVNSGRTILFKDVKKLRDDYLRILEEIKLSDSFRLVTDTYRPTAGRDI